MVALKTDEDKPDLQNGRTSTDLLGSPVEGNASEGRPSNLVDARVRGPDGKVQLLSVPPYKTIFNAELVLAYIESTTSYGHACSR